MATEGYEPRRAHWRKHFGHNTPDLPYGDEVEPEVDGIEVVEPVQFAEVYEPETFSEVIEEPDEESVEE